MAERPDLPLEQALSIAIENRLLDVHTCVPGQVVAYNPATKRAEVKPMVKRALRGLDEKIVHEPLPTIPNVPIAWLAGGGFELHFPLAPGDTGWLLFSEVPTSAYYSSGQVSDAGDPERFGLSSPLFLPCARTASTAAGANLVAPAPFTVGNPASAQLVALATLVLAELNKIKAAFDAHTHIVPITGPVGTTPTAPPAVPIPAISPVAATKLRAE